MDLPLHVARRGDRGPPIVLIHGFGANAATWGPWADALGRHHQLHLIDLKGFGRAPKPADDRYSPYDLADLVVRYLRQERLANITLVGHSLGGAVALLVGLELFERSAGQEPRRQVVVSGAVFPQSVPPFIRLAATRGLGPLALRLIPPHWLMRQALRRMCFDSATVTESQVEAYAGPLREPGGVDGLVRAARALIPADADQVVARYAHLDVPTLALWGRQDRVIPLQVGERLTQVLPRCELVILEQCGHIPSEERPRESLDAVLRFLKRHPISASILEPG